VALIAIVLLVFVGMCIYPFLKAALLHWAMAIVKFESKSYWRAFFCVLIGVGVTIMVQSILLSLSMRGRDTFDPLTIQKDSLVSSLVGLALTPFAETIAVLFFFKESSGKVIGAVALHWLLCLATVVALIILFFVVALTVNLITG